MRFLVWTGVEEWLAETAVVELGDHGLRATGTQIGADPEPYRVDYRLEAPDDFVTGELELTATTESGRHSLLLRRDRSGGWSTEGGELPDLAGAVDIDIENSPLTNTMPILRHGFQQEGSGDFVMAFVRTPSLRVEASPQRYEHVRTTETGSVVRYISRDGDFTADLELDPEGLLIHYPRLARRIEPGLKVG
jgi:hypothetical protein